MMNPFRLIFLLFLMLVYTYSNGQKFAVIGDYGMDGVYEDSVAQLVKSWEPDFIITTGDNNYPAGADSTIDRNVGKYYHDYIFPYYGSYAPNGTGGDSVNRFFPSPGNHDNLNFAKPYLDYFTLPEAYPGNERYYTFTRGHVQLIALNSDSSSGHEPDGTSGNSSQAYWMLGALCASSAPWKIVYFHHPPYSSGYTHGSQTWMQWPFAAWGVTAVLSGHEHNYERIMEGSLPYFVNGLGGKSIYGFSESPIPGSAARYNGNYGAMLVTANPDSITFCFRNIRDSLIDCLTLYVNTGIDDQAWQAELAVVPNPFRDRALVQTGYNLRNAILNIYNDFGQLVRQQIDLSGYSLVLQRENLPCGIYFLRLTEEGRLISTGRFVIRD